MDSEGSPERLDIQCGRKSRMSHLLSRIYTSTMNQRMCSTCKGSPKPLNWKVFKVDKDGNYSKTCKSCQAKAIKRAADKKKSNEVEGEHIEVDGDEDVELSVLPLNEFTHLLEEINVSEELEAVVDIDPIVENTSPAFNLKKHDFDVNGHRTVWPAEFRKQADAIAQMVWDTTGYRYK